MVSYEYIFVFIYALDGVDQSDGPTAKWVSLFRYSVAQHCNRASYWAIRDAVMISLLFCHGGGIHYWL